eukprot:9105621-Pyramimonas_sp.AAC.1
MGHARRAALQTMYEATADAGRTYMGGLVGALRSGTTFPRAPADSNARQSAANGRGELTAWVLEQAVTHPPPSWWAIIGGAWEGAAGACAYFPHLRSALSAILHFPALFWAVGPG